MNLYVLRATLRNPKHPECGEMTLPFPIPEAQYNAILGMLLTIQMGDVLQRDCLVTRLDSDFPALQCLEQQTVNFDELDYLSSRLESFVPEERLQFCAAVEGLGYSNMTDLINLTFCCQEATVISDFANLEEEGKEHYLNLHGGSALTEELEKLDGQRIAEELIRTGHGIVTRFGVLYKNDMELKPLYEEKSFPAYVYEPKILDAFVYREDDPETPLAFVQLPMPEAKVRRTLVRAGIEPQVPVSLSTENSLFPACVTELLKERFHSLEEWNDVCRGAALLSYSDQRKLEAVLKFAKPDDPAQVRQLAQPDMLALFSFLPRVAFPADGARCLINESGCYQFDEILGRYSNYSDFGQRWIEEHPGEFLEEGYVSYDGIVPLDELLHRSVQTEEYEMGGIV